MQFLISYIETLLYSLKDGSLFVGSCTPYAAAETAFHQAGAPEGSKTIRRDNRQPGPREMFRLTYAFVSLSSPRMWIPVMSRRTRDKDPSARGRYYRIRTTQELEGMEEKLHSRPLRNNACYLSRETRRNSPLMPQTLPIFHRRQTSTSSTDSATKPPSIFRYTLILLKARPTPSDIEIISDYTSNRTPPAYPVLLIAPQTVSCCYFEPHSLVVSETGREGYETPPPPYTP
ncbi:hypothetical protein CC78DRAFT_567180 [Lojkania enalia]|uniref:Uncharacterized protein n=1 Tax=Lojkania enalia TaxID=147567 RepID=A0A9P4KEA4_9PLEO|nr:hypothetical protein CC78DRAFT_567180 [Didymosphaeria enalia]